MSLQQTLLTTIDKAKNRLSIQQESQEDSAIRLLQHTSVHLSPGISFPCIQQFNFFRNFEEYEKEVTRHLNDLNIHHLSTSTAFELAMIELYDKPNCFYIHMVFLKQLHTKMKCMIIYTAHVLISQCKTTHLRRKLLSNVCFWINCDMLNNLKDQIIFIFRITTNFQFIARYKPQKSYKTSGLTFERNILNRKLNMKIRFLEFFFAMDKISF